MRQHEKDSERGAVRCTILVAEYPRAGSGVRNRSRNSYRLPFQHGIMLGDSNGEMHLESGLTRAQLATVLTRLNGDLEYIQTNLTYYAGQCKFSDVPEWAKPYVGYCYTNGLMLGYDTGAFGADDGVTPAAACTVVLRYMELSDVDWDYSTACRTALDLGLTSAETVKKPK